jgi:6-phosphogluconolactonase
VNISPDNRFLVVADLGLDQLRVYRFDPGTGSLTPNDPPFLKIAPGSGPRHLVFSSDGRLSWVLNEMAATITALSYDQGSGRFTERQTVSALPGDFTGVRSAAEIVIHPSGRFLYTSNRGHDSIATFNVDSSTGFLEPVAWVQTRGKTPRNFAIDPDGSYLLVANQDSGTLGVFRIDPKNGALIPTGDPVETPVPVSLVFVEQH